MKNNLKDIRKQHNLTVSQLSRTSGVSHLQIIKLEHGYTKNIDFWTAYRLSFALQVHVHEIFPI